MSDTTKAVAVQEVHGNTMFSDTGRFALAQRAATVFANSQLVPQHLRGKVADCVIALNIAERLGEDPLTIMQSIYVVSGKAGWSSSYMIARINQSGAIKGRITWDIVGKGKDLEVTAKATLADTGEVVTATASMQMAIAEGWTNNKKYQSMPEQMLRFRSAAMLQRLYFPEVMLGMRTAEELETEPAPAMKDVTPQANTVADTLASFVAQAAPAQPGPMVESHDEPAPGPNVIDRDDPVQVEELEKRTGIKKDAEPVVIDAEDAERGEAFDPSDYLKATIKRLKAVKSAEELKALDVEVSVILREYPEYARMWNSASAVRLNELQDSKPAKTTR